MTYTEEQQDIINSNEENIIVLAKAGTGKTSTLIEYAKKRPLNSFLYLAYNNSIRKSSIKKFFGNTTVHTIHSLAYEEIGHLYKEKLKEQIKLIDLITGIDILNKEFILDKNNPDIFLKASKLLNYLNYYFSSSNFCLSELNIEKDEIELLNEYWFKMQDINNKNVKMTHDGYLKLFQISEPELKYEYILIDEAQDSNEVMLDIIMKQYSKKIFVGDIDQEIYGFRNAHNIFKNEKFDNFKKFYLTNSFRFGESVAYLANLVLSTFKDNPILVKGINNDEIVLNFEEKDKITIITRTNAYLFDLAAKETLKNKKLYIVGGESFVFSEIEDCYNLYKGNLYKIKNFYIKQFSSFEKLKIFAKKTKDMELLFLVKIIEKYNEMIPDLIKKIEYNLVRKECFADIVLSTTHKSKGLEFDNVKLGDDFFPLYTKNGLLKNKELIPYEEINLYYVAITRTVEKIELNYDILKLIS